MKRGKTMTQEKLMQLLDYQRYAHNAHLQKLLDDTQQRRLISENVISENEELSDDEMNLNAAETARKGETGMTDEARKFLIKASQDKILGAKLEELKNETDKEKLMARTAAIAKEAGYNLKPEDFSLREGEMNDEEMVDVAGGWKQCACVALGGGTADPQGKACACIEYGAGVRKDDGEMRCQCFNFGGGYDLG
jgi:hypothetical protein